MRQKTLIYVLFVVVLLVSSPRKLFSQEKVFFNKENSDTFLSLECLKEKTDNNNDAIILSILLPKSNDFYQLPLESNNPQNPLIFREKKVEKKQDIYLYEIKKLGSFNLDLEKSRDSKRRDPLVGYITGEIRLDENGNCQLEVSPEINRTKTRGEVSLDSLYAMYSKELNSERKNALRHFIHKNEDIEYSIDVDTLGLNQTYKFRIYHADSIKILETNLGEIDPLSLIDGKTITVSIPEEDEVLLILQGKEPKPKIKINYRYGEGLKADFSSTSSEAIHFKIQGGKAPYFLSFPDGNGINRWKEYFRLEKKNDEYILNRKSMDQYFFEGGFRELRIYDRSREGFVVLPLENKIPIGEELVESNKNNTVYYLVFAFLFLIGGFAIRKFIFKLKKKEEEHKEAKENKEVLEEADSRTDEELIIPVKKKRLKVLNKRKVPGEIQPEIFELITQTKGYSKPIQLHELWSDTILKQVYLSIPFVEDLHDFLKRENLESVTEERIGMVPEIGGFIMGRYATVPDIGLSLLLEEFVPFIPEYSDAFKIEIGTKTQVKELASALEKFPDKGVMGWFHTHPGHGLFLSNPDLEVHKHFPYPFQVAMEIESLTKELDLAFFTQKENGEMNNTYTSGKPEKWFSWRAIENKLSQN